uniref:Transmembrane protein 8B n=1 Tax=Naja naja TaxID=35670 RepID=A0A8C7DVY8_NAJNA
MGDSWTGLGSSDRAPFPPQGLAEDCQYLFQPQLIVQHSFARRVFVPSYTSRVLVQLRNCHRGNQSAPGCPLGLRVRGKAPPLHNSTAVDCREQLPCRLVLERPFWQNWYFILVEKLLPLPDRISFQLGVQLKGGLALADLLSPSLPSSFQPPATPTSPRPPRGGEHCWPTRPTLRNELDTFSVHFYIFFGPNVSVPPNRPAVFAINLLPVLDSGGILNLELKLNVVRPFGSPATQAWLFFHLLAGHSPSGQPGLGAWPQAAGGMLPGCSLPLCRPSFCGNVTAEVYLRAFLSPCINDCGPYGQCKLLRSNNYLYAACECKAGWSGWGCTDNAAAFSYGFQLLSTLLLCLSNLMFVPPVAIAVRTGYLLEAAVYIFTMFFSTFYHACDQPGIVVFCIMDYDVLQFCDFLGSLMSVWVTVIAMARLQPVIKQVLYLLGAMLLSMALQLDRHGLWNLLGPSLFATVRSIRRRHCYPPTWQRWTFCLLPGALIAASAVLLYAFVETEENYFYIHSIWHMLIAGSVGFLLPPQPKAEASGLAGPLPCRKGCGYQLCINEQEELGLVDPGTAGPGVSITSVCTS